MERYQGSVLLSFPFVVVEDVVNDVDDFEMLSAREGVTVR